MHVFSLSDSLAVVSRSFKVRSRVHCKTQNKLSNEKTHQQCCLIYNSAQHLCIQKGILTKKHDDSVEKLLINGYNSFLSDNGGTLAELVSTGTHA